MKESTKLNLWFMSSCSLKTSKTQDNSKDFESLELCMLSDLKRAAQKTFLCLYKIYEKQSRRLGKFNFSLRRKFKLLSKLRRMLKFIFHLILSVQILTCLTCSRIDILENSECCAGKFLAILVCQLTLSYIQHCPEPHNLVPKTWNNAQSKG